MSVLLWLLEGIALVGSAYVLVSRRLLRAGVALLVVLGSLGFIYFGLGQDAAGAVQLLMYAGGVSILLLFGVAATKADDRGLKTPFFSFLSGLALASAVAAVLLYNLPIWARNQPTSSPVNGSVADAGLQLIKANTLPFEWAALLLLLALTIAAPMAAGLAKPTHIQTTK